LHRDRRIDCSDLCAYALNFLDNHAAGAWSDLIFRLEGLVREMRVTCSQDAVSPEINAQFLFQRVFNINFRQDTESFFFQFLENPADSVVKGRLYGLAKVV
jgi:hypothetical protein